MSAIDTAKDVVRIASTAGLAKDVIDLMEKKIALLTGEIDDLTLKNTALSKRTSSLVIENSQLRAQLGNPQPVVLDDACTKMLQAVANATGDITKQDLFEQLGLPLAKGDHLFDQLSEHAFIEQRGMNLMTGGRYGATKKGRDYLSRKNLL
jgi:regulator of replication initiation timing